MPVHAPAARASVRRPAIQGLSRAANLGRPPGGPVDAGVPEVESLPVRAPRPRGRAPDGVGDARGCASLGGAGTRTRSAGLSVPASRRGPISPRRPFPPRRSTMGSSMATASVTASNVAATPLTATPAVRLSVCGIARRRARVRLSTHSGSPRRFDAPPGGFVWA